MTGTTILFREFPFDQLDQLAPLVSRAYSITEYDARAKIRQGWGFLERDIPASEAEGIAAALAPWMFVIDNDNSASLPNPS